MMERDGGPRASGTRASSMVEVAARAGVSHQTVSRVINGSPLVREETRARVLAAIDELGYRRNLAARALVTKRSKRIGMVSAHLALHGPTMIATAVNEAAQAAGYDASFVGLNEISPARLREAVDRLLEQSVEAVVVAVAQEEAIETTRSLGIPVPLVTVEGVRPGEPLSAGIDQVHGGRLATAHLLDLGHRCVAHVTGPLEWMEAQQRRDGWLAAHADRGVSPGPVLAGDWNCESGYLAGLELARDPSVTAVFAANDNMALGVLRAMHEAGRSVPVDVSVVGFDDVPEAAYLWPALTTVSQAFSSLGRLALELALRAIEGEEQPTAPLIRPELVVRSSTAKPR